MKSERHAVNCRQASYALVITLLGVVLLTVIVVSFMEAMTLSVGAAKSYADIRRETLAAQAALDTAVAQMSLVANETNAAGVITNAFVTGLTNIPTTGTPFVVTVLGQGDLTNPDQMMPMISGPLAYLSNFGTVGWGTSGFAKYTAPLTAPGSATNTVDLNVYSNNTTAPYPYIEQVNDINKYRAPWVTMTNMVGNEPQYTRFAYVVLDNTARINPALMTGTGTNGTSAFVNPTNWYAGPQDLNATYITNNSGTASILTASQMQQIANPGSALGSSDATLGEAFPDRPSYEAVKNFFTSDTNASFDVIPTGMADGGKPKYNINDLATNPIYGSDPLMRSTNIASIIERNLTNFYKRDPVLSAPSVNNTNLYINRVAANIVDYINTNGAFGITDYTNAASAAIAPGVSPAGLGVYPIEVHEQIFATQGGAGTAAHSTSLVSTAFWLECWNPYTIPVTIKTATLSVTGRPGYTLGGSLQNSTPDYLGTVSVISDSEGTGSANIVVAPNEFVVLGFPANATKGSPFTVTGSTTTQGPISANSDVGSLEQFSLNINGQTVAQTQAQVFNSPKIAAGANGGLQHESQAQIAATNIWEGDYFSTTGTGVGDPRFISYYNQSWNNTHDLTTAYVGTSWWKGRTTTTGSATWSVMTVPAVPPLPAQTSTWTIRDNIARATSAAGNSPTTGQETPDQVPSAYNQANDSNAAPEVMKNAPMVSIGELGHIMDPAYANDALLGTIPTSLIDNYSSPYLNGGGRSLRIGRPESNGSVVFGGSATAASWDVDGERAIDLLDLFTVNNTNAPTSTTGVNYTNLVSGGSIGRINPNTAPTNVIAAVLQGIEITSDSGMGTVQLAQKHLAGMAAQIVANRPYSRLSDMYTNMILFDSSTNYNPQPSGITGSKYMNVYNRFRQEAFGKLVQHLTVQSRSYRVYVIGQVLDQSQHPKGSVVMEANVYLQYNPTESEYEPVVQSVQILNE